MEDIQNEANAQGVDVNEYLNFMKSNGLVEKTEDPQIQQSAPVGSIEPALDTDLPSEDISSESQEDPSGLSTSLASFGLGFLEFGKGLSSINEGIQLGLKELFTPGEMTEAEKKAELIAIRARSFISGPVPPSIVYKPAIEKLEEKIPEYETQSITEDIQKGNYAQAAKRTVDGALRSAPSLVAAATGVGGLIALGTSAAGNKFEEEFEANPDQNTGKLLLNAGATGATEATFELATRGLLKRAGLLRQAGNAEAARKLLEGGAKNLVKNLGISLTGEAASEASTELTVALIDAIPKEYGGLGKKIDANDLAYRLGDAAIIGSFVGGGLSTVGEVANMSSSAKDRAEAILTPDAISNKVNESAGNINKLVEDLTEATEDGKTLINEKIEQERSNIINLRKEASELLGNLEGEDLQAYAQNIDKIEKAKSLARKANTESEKKIAKEQYDSLTEANNDILKSSAKKVLDKNIANVEKVSKQIYGDDVEIKRLSSDQVKTFIEDNPNLSNDTKKSIAEEAALSQGFFQAEDVDGKQFVVINEDVASSTYATNVAGHEFLHKVLNQTFKNNAKTQVEVGSALINKLAEMDLEQVTNSKFARRLAEYSAAPENVQAEEILTVLSDSIATGDLQFNNNIFTKIGDVIRRALQDIGLKSVKFNTGKDVYNFIKDYNKSIEKGRLRGAVKKAAVGGVTGELVTEPIQEIDEATQKFSKESPLEAINKILPQDIKTKEQYDNFVNDPRKGAELFNSIIQPGGVINNYIRSRQLTKEEGDKMVERVTDRVLGFNPEETRADGSVVGREGFGERIFADTRFAKLDAKKALALEAERTKQQTSLDDEFARQVVAEESTTTEPERRTKGKVIADKLNIADKVASEVAEANIDPSTLTNFKSVPSAVPKTVGELLGINPIKLQRTVIDEKTGKKIKNKKFKANLTAGEVASAQRWFNTNRQIVIDGLPQGFDESGKSTGVPGTILDALYTKKETRAQTAAGLKGQVKRRNIKDSEFLALIDIIDKVPTRNRDTSARVIALADLLGKTITNQELRKTDPSLARIRSGMSDVMFSKVEDIIVNPEFEGDLKNINKLLDAFIQDGTFKHTTKEEIDSFYEAVENVWAKNLPKDLITKTVLRPSNRILPGKGKSVISVDGVDTTIDQYYTKKRDEFLAREDVEYGENFSDEGANYKYGRTYGNMFGDTPQAISKANSNGTIDSINKANLSMHRQLWQRVNESIKQDANNAKAWGNYFALVAQDVTHPHRMGAEMIGWTMKPKGHKGKMYEWEHAMPATRAYLYLMEASLDENIDFDSAYDLVIDNFKLIALDKADDMKLKAAGRQTSMGRGWTVFDNWYDRYFDKEVAKQGGIDPKGIKGLDGRTFDSIFNVNVEGGTMFSKPIGQNPNISEAIINARPVLQYSKESRGMSTFDFDETLIIDGENFIVAKKGDDVQRISSGDWPLKGPQFAADGYEFDFTDFVNVRGGVDGPLLQKMKNQIKKYGTQNVFVLTARPAESATAIHEWLKTKGINIPFENITGLGNSTGDAKAQWFIDKYAEGYNDMYFVDDALPNVEAVKHVFDQLDIKGKSVQAKIQFSKSIASTLSKNKSYNKFKDSLTESVFYHGGLNSLKNKNAVWFIVDDINGAELYADVRDVKDEVYSVKASQLKNSIIIPDINDSFGFDKIIKQKFPDQYETLVNSDGQVTIEKVLEVDNAAEIISEYMSWADNKFELFEGVYGPEEGLYDNAGKIAKTLPVIVLNTDVSGKAKQVKPSAKFSKSSLRKNKSVQHIIDQLDVKGESVQARLQFSKEMSSEFNKMLERTKGQKRGKNVGRFEFFVPPSADDFAGLLRSFVGKGKQGDADLKFFKKALIDPFARADEEMKRARQAIMDDYKTLRKEFPDVVKKLGDLTDTESGFTFDNAVRVYLWDKAGFEIPGLSKRDIQKLVNVVKTDQDLKNFADTLGLVSKNKEGYIKPTEYWNVESIAADLQNIVNKEGRKKYLAEWVENKDQIFSKENLNKIEAVYGSNFREALENMLWRMENGTNRPRGMGRLEAAWNNWVNNSVGAIMFFNARSAVLQTLSSVNFINFEDNNIFAAAKAFGNQKQYWKDFSFLFNSDFLKQRRAGLQTNINEAELASAVAGASNKAKAALQYLLKIGFTPTQIADSFAIAAGGSTYYRNRIKKYVKEGLSQSEAESKAMLDFQEIAEETQQSARPDRISQQQASSLGRIILAFANTPMQYARLIKKAAKDLAAGRGDWRSNVSRIIYYGAVQNIIFSALQSAIFALAFDDEDPKEDEINTKTLRTLNGVVDSLLRGSGLAGAAVATIKNTVMRFLQESNKGFRADYGNVLVDALSVSPPIGSKARKLYNALKTYKFNRDEMGEMETFDLENPVWDAVGNVVSATTNVPLDRGFRKIDNMKEALDQDNQTWQRIALALGWDQWSLGVEQDKKPKATKSKGRSSIEKAKERRRKRLEKLRNR